MTFRKRCGVYKARSHLSIGLVQSLANIGLSDLKNFLRKCKAIHLKKKKKKPTDKMSCRLSSNYHGFLIGKTTSTRKKDAQKAFR